MKLSGRATRMIIHIGEDDVYHHKPLYHEIVRRAHNTGLAGASVFRGVEGYGAGSLIHTTRFLSMSEDLPIAIVIVDEDEKLRAFLPDLDELVTEGLITLEEVEVIRHAGPSHDDEDDESDR